MKRIVSGIQPSGEITIGNYIGAIKQFVQLQNEYEMFIMIVDQHAITVPQDKTLLRKRIKDMAALYIACGVDPERANIFIQSEVPAHSQLSWIMECHTYFGELSRMTQFKDKSANKALEGVSGALFTYPSLMAADILLYDTEVVPVGSDQKQHLELTRDLATRFNNKYGDTFIVPEPFIAKSGARIMDLQNPEKKMSKSSDNEKSFIKLLDDPRAAKNKIKSAITDSDAIVKYDKVNKPGISNLIDIYSSLKGLSIADIEGKYDGMGYKELKEDLGNIVEDFLVDIQTKFNNIRNSGTLDEILDNGANIANKIASKKITKVYNKVGLGRKK